MPLALASLRWGLRPRLRSPDSQCVLLKPLSGRSAGLAERDPVGSVGGGGRGAPARPRDTQDRGRAGHGKSEWRRAAGAGSGKAGSEVLTVPRGSCFSSEEWCCRQRGRPVAGEATASFPLRGLLCCHLLGLFILEYKLISFKTYSKCVNSIFNSNFGVFYAQSTPLSLNRTPAQFLVSGGAVSCSGAPPAPVAYLGRGVLVSGSPLGGALWGVHGSKGTCLSNRQQVPSHP